MNNDDEQFEIPSGAARADDSGRLQTDDRLIELDPVQQENGEQEEAWAVEGEYHDIPSLKNMLYEDARQVKDQLLANMEESGTFLSIKEAVKKVMPHQYQFLKELKEILTDRNSVKDI